MTRRGRYVLGLAVASGLTAALAVRFGPSLVLALALASPSLQAWQDRVIAPPVPEAVRVATAGGDLAADLYRPSTPRGAILLIHGLSTAGRRHPELVRLARLLAQHGQLVLVPDFEGLKAFRLTGREVEEIQWALRDLRARHEQPAVAGLSFGAGPALIAAAQAPRLRLAASFGGYADLRHVIGFVTTGVHAFAGRRYTERQQEYNRWKLLALLAGFADDTPDRELLDAIAARKLADPGTDTGVIAARLSPDGQAILALALNRREDAVAPLLGGLSPRARRALDELSPIGAAARLPGRLLIAHGAADDSIPFTESLRLAEAAGSRARVVVFRTFHHTGPRDLWDSLGPRAADAWDLLRLVDDLVP